VKELIERFGYNGVVCLDGGMGQELRRRSPNEPTGLWSAQALLDVPELVREVHEDYIRAGAKVITTNSYATVRSRLIAAGFDDDFEKLIRLAGQIAVASRDAVGEDILIAGSLPPLNGSYRPDRVLDRVQLEPVYREHAELLAPYVDVFICETMSTIEEAQVAATAAAQIGKPVWVAWTLKDDGAPMLRSGEALTDAFAALSHIEVSAVLANCCSPESITGAMADLQSMGTPLFGGYGNGFGDIPADWTVQSHGVDALGQRKNNGPDDYAGHVLDWTNAGANLVGGCCEITPSHIARLTELLKASL